MIKIKNIYLVVMIILLSNICECVYAHGVPTHIAIGRNTFEIWRDFDRAFYDSLTKDPSNSQERLNKLKLIKFYYIGLTLPDMFQMQSGIKVLFDSLYPKRNNFEGGPLKITDLTFNNTRLEISFIDPPPNANLTKLKQMAEYARNQGWTPYEKALIYGAYMHVIQDIYGHMVLQPSRFGYGFSIDADSALTEPILGFGETWYEIFSNTHIPFYSDINQYLFRGVRDPLGQVIPVYLSMEFYREFGTQGSGGNPGWQDQDFPPVQKFIQAANAVNYRASNLTQERLESYLHGWAIILTFLCGNNGNGGNSGAICGHPNWTEADIRSFIADIVTDYATHWSVYIPIPGLNDLIRWGVKKIAYKEVYNKLGKWLDSLPTGRTWSEVFETPQFLEEGWTCVPLENRTPENTRAYKKTHRNLTYWYDNAEVKKPNFRSSYDQEITDASNLSELYKTSLTYGEQYLDYNMNNVDIWTISRKAGLTGGMYSVPNENYVRQPGVLNIGLIKDGIPIWAKINVGLQGGDTGDMENVNFFYDLIPFGPTRLKLIGRTSSGNEIELSLLENLSATPNRWYGDNILNFQQIAYNYPDIREIFFRIETQDMYGGDFVKMLDSDYRQAFWSTQVISSNALYQQRFNWGDPFRKQDQNPFQNPLAFWPYACSLNVVDYYLSHPTVLYASINSQNLYIDLNWTDNSNHEHHFEIKRVNLDNNDSITFELNGNQGTGLVNWTDDNAEFGCVYRYSVRAKREQWYSDWSNPVEYSLTFSDSAVVTAYSHANKVVKSGNNVHLTYFGENPGENERVIYINSPDGGNTWGSIEQVSPNEDAGMFPAIACDNSGTPYIVWAKKWEWIFDPGEGTPKSHWKTHYFLAKKENGQWQNYSKFQFTINDSTGEHRPNYELLQPSFVIKNDTGYIAYVMLNEQGLQYNLWLGKFSLDNTIAPWKYLLGTCSGEHYPSLMVDTDGRLIVTQSLENAVKVWYIDDINGSLPSFTINNLGLVHNLSASLEYGRNLLLSWCNPNGNQTIKFMRVVKQTNGSYEPKSIETVITDINSWCDVHPKIVNIDILPCVILYEGYYQPTSTNCIFYAFRFGDNKWRVKPINSESNLFQSLYPQGFISNNWMTTYWTGTDVGPGAYYLQSKKSNLLPDLLSTFFVSCDMASGPNNGTHLMRVPNTKELYIAFQEQNQIYCSHSYDEGENWETKEIDNGLYPCLGLNYKGLPWIAYVRDGDLVCKMKRDDGSWKEMLIFDGNENLWAGPPSMHLATMPIKEDVIDYAYITYPVYDGTMPDSPEEQPPVNNCSYIYVSLFDTIGIDIVTHLIDEGPAQTPVSHPCVGVTPADLVHICWQKDNEIYYITNIEKVTPENWQQVEWTPIYNVSESEEISKHPFVEAYGEEVFVVWSEGEPGEIIRRPRVVWYGYDEWGEPENMSNSPDYDSDYPQMSSSDIILWQEQDQESYKVYAYMQGNVSCLTPEANNISYVHTNVLITDAQAPAYIVYYCYTDEITEGELYEVKFDKYEYAAESGGDEEFVYYEAKLGEEVASTYLESRDGFINYGNYKIDYGNNLKYKLKYLNPYKKYLFQGILYQCTSATIQQKLEIEDTVASDNTISYAIPETISFFIRKNSYKDDLLSKVKIKKIQGAYAVLARFKIYEYETIDSTGGSGPQSNELNNISIPTMLYAPNPNPFTNQTQIRFQIPVKTRVDIKVYNSAGRLVNTIMSSEMNPGYYTMTWNGKDELNRTQANGIYFVRLKTQGYDATKKMILVR